jgi:adenosylcobinamide-phosphate synthase
VSAALLAAAMILDALLGEPRWLWSRVPHPAVVMGRLIGWADRRCNAGRHRKARGVALVAGLVALAAAIGMLIATLPGGAILTVLLTAALLAQRSLVDHVQAVGDGLRLSLASGRDAVAKIVGRDTRDMDRPAVARAAIESAAENFSDGVIAPLFWFALAGLPGLLVYKIVNTADSMIGYRTPRHAEFGWAAARLDDVLNWVPARLSAILIATAHLRFDIAATVRRDAPLHRSPNAGWPEAAMAACLDLSLAGPRSYGGTVRDFPWVNPQGRRDIGAPDIDAAVRALWRSWAAMLALVLAAAIILAVA